MSHFLLPLLREPSRTWALRNKRTGAILASRLEPAFDSATRRRGLLGRDRVSEGSALVLAPCSAIHTFFMRFPIDLVFVRKNGRVVRVCPAVAPWRMRLGLSSFAVVELGAGAAGVAGIERGDPLELVAPDAGDG